MYWIIFGIFTVLFIVSLIFDFDNGDILCCLGTFPVWCLIIVLGLCCLLPKYMSAKSIDEEIAIVEAANQATEEEIAISVQTYMEYEGKELSSLKPDTKSANLVAFAESYPELKSSELIQEQIKTYKKNKNEIVELKREKAKIRVVLKFWLFKNYS